MRKMERAPNGRNGSSSHKLLLRLLTRKSAQAASGFIYPILGLISAALLIAATVAVFEVEAGGNS